MNKYFIDSDEKIAEALALFPMEYIGVDTETNGLSAISNRLLCIQISSYDDAILIPYNAISSKSKKLVEDFFREKIIVAHNAKFDYKFLTENNIYPKDMYCTQVIEEILYAGKYFTFKLKDLVKRRFQIELSKEVRKDFYDGTFEAIEAEHGSWGVWEFRPDLVEYALDDVEYLLEIRDQQQTEAQEFGMGNVEWLETNLLPVVARMELRGVYMDVPETKKFQSKVLLRRDTLGQEIFTILENSYNLRWQKEYARRMELWNSWKAEREKVKNLTATMRDPLNKTRKTDEAHKLMEENTKMKPFSKQPELNNVFNPDSPIKLREALSQAIGIELTTTKADWLEENVDIHPVIADLVEYRKFVKLAQFCELTEDINEITGRIHAIFKPTGTKSGRFSCVPMNTTALTRNGWKTYDELLIGEDILAYDMETGNKVWTPILNKTKLKNRVVGSVGTENRRLRCTDDHKWVVRKGHDTTVKGKLYVSKESLIEAKDIIRGHRILMNSQYYTEDCVEFDVSSTRKYETDYTELITRMSKKQLDSFILGFLLADGHNTKPTKIGTKYGWQWTQARTVTREQLLTATYLQHNGRVGVGRHYKSIIDTHNSSDRVVLCVSPYTAVSKVWEAETVEDVWCPTTKYGTWVMRQGDLISITGNCVKPNLQQIPARSDEAKEFRGLFRPREGYKFVGADFAGIELVILAEYSKEQILIDAINSGKDVHCFTMSLFLGCNYDILVKLKNKEELDLKENLMFEDARKSFNSRFSMPELLKLSDAVGWVKKLRDYTKTMTYGAVYGLTPYGLSLKFHCSFQEAEKFLQVLFTSYPNLKKFLKQQEDLGYKRLYAVNPLGRRRWFSVPRKKSYKEIEQEVIKSLDKQKRLWDSVTDQEWDSLISDAIKVAEKEYKGKINYIRRQAGNFFPQSLCAEIMKLSMWRFDTNYKTDDPSEGLVLTVHDEAICEIKDENVERACKVLEEVMVKSAKKFLPSMNIEVKPVVSDRWVK